jgi:hypothetical protein
VLVLGFVAYEGHRAAVDGRADASSWSRSAEESDREARERRVLADELGYSGEQRKEFIRETETRSIVTSAIYRSATSRRDEGTRRRNLALWALPMVPVGAPILWFIFLWVAAGFRKRLAD